MANEGPVLTIDMKNYDFIVFKDITFLHSGVCLQSKFKESAPIEPKYLMEPNYRCVKEFEIQPNMDTILYLKSGGALFRNCILTFKSHPRKLKSRLSLIVTLPDTFLNLTSCQLYGHEENHNAGAILIKSDVMISDCTFKTFNAGALYCLGNPGFPKIKYDHKSDKETVNQPFTIRDSLISNCNVMGIYLHGHGSKQQVIRVKIETVLGPAIKVYKGNYAKIKGCELKNCRIGVHVVSAQPHILMNTIT